MSPYNLQVLCAFGLESLVAAELEELGYQDLRIENGKVSFIGTEKDIVLCNIHLHIAERIVIKIAGFSAFDFEELFQNTLQFAWENFLPLNARIHVTGKSNDSKLSHIPSCQSIVKKAIIKAMKRKYAHKEFKEDGPLYKTDVHIKKNIVTLTVDTTGPGLHKRGYRLKAGEAPLKETLAAALIRISRWQPAIPLLDPFCGSGTIPIEAVLLATNKAPGLHRSFPSEQWPQIPKTIWQEIRQKARGKEKKISLNIMASDKDDRILAIAKKNAEEAGAAHLITFQNTAFENVQFTEQSGYLITNPPYGDRIGELPTIKKIYQLLGKKYSQNMSWAFYILTAYTDFIRNFQHKADKNRKLYNGKIKCYFYQYFKNFLKKT